MRAGVCGLRNVYFLGFCEERIAVADYFADAACIAWPIELKRDYVIHHGGFDFEPVWTPGKTIQSSRQP
jgi:hypothetical protein